MNHKPEAAPRGRPGYSREDIISAAVQAFTTHGYEATSMGKIAGELGITKSALYHHIASKEEILELSIQRALDELEDVVQRAGQADCSPAEKVKFLVRDSVDVLCRDPESVSLLLRLRGNSEVENQALERRRNITRSMVPLVQDAQDSGELRSDIDAALLIRMCFGMVNSVADWYDADGKLSAEQIADVLSDVLFRGLCKSC